ncbi:MAG: tRNA (N(6)-L-threonylcarbamoyladenosine(37)-C(2))-methylthiotransferase MtaB [Chloroflexi bacterium RBG_13_46_9]|nr:MAG: tRNA (N(6)-L-threonylcarbamoyladenosine(37)-C(2))-methylthiotransferase MtaB [Chloroflexi bacterium RBG_13_46_9]
MKIAFETLGCKLNQAETETLARNFSDAGHELVKQIEDADIYILNTCTVTQTADSKSRHLIRQAHRHNPNARIVITGCYAERAPLDLENLEEADMVVGNQGRTSLVKRLEREGYLKKTLNSSSSKADSIFRTRTFIKIQDGCQNFCAYCIVPYVRTHEESEPDGEIVEQVKQRVKEGCQEIVLTGTRIGAYSYNGLSLKDLVKRILSETDIRRLRLSSLQPQEISIDLLTLWQDNRLCPHFHLSLQSGSDSVLKRMQRRYTSGEYEKMTATIRTLVTGVAITTDVIVGFPGETEQEFEESMNFCHRLNFARIHVFPFSPRSGTEAAGMEGQIPVKIKKERTRLMLELAEESARNFRELFSGEELDVLWEKQTGQGVWSGVTGNYIRVYKKESNNITNKLSAVKLR